MLSYIPAHFPEVHSRSKKVRMLTLSIRNAIYHIMDLSCDNSQQILENCVVRPPCRVGIDKS